MRIHLSLTVTDVTLDSCKRRESVITQAFVSLTSNAETNILACLTAKRMGVRKTVAAVENLDYVALQRVLTSERSSIRKLLLPVISIK